MNKYELGKLYPVKLVAYDMKWPENESYHIHMGPLDQEWLWDRIYFRDYLINNPDEAGNYGKLKKRLASRYTYDREAYTESKAGYIIKRLRKKQKKNCLNE